MAEIHRKVFQHYSVQQKPQRREPIREQRHTPSRGSVANKRRSFDAYDPEPHETTGDTPIPLAAQICPSRHTLIQPAKRPQSTQKPRVVSHTLAAKSPQGRGGDEAECLLVAVKS